MFTEKEIGEILNQYDPVGLLSIGAPLDEYADEARSIYNQLGGTLDRERITEVIRSVFKEAFSLKDVELDDSIYEKIAGEIFELRK